MIAHDEREATRLAERTPESSSSVILVEKVSPWWRSRRKRVFDFLCVFFSMPVVLPILVSIAIAVRTTSVGPALFLQKRTGRNGQPFTIVKFRTMLHRVNTSHRPVTTSSNQRFTVIGPFLRRWKLDELPQLLNVLVGHMSLVGPRPKIVEHEPNLLPCRPGITGPATLIFAREERFLNRIPQQALNTYYHEVVLPAKRDLDFKYMEHATFRSDLRLILDSMLGRWDDESMERLLRSKTTEVQSQMCRIPAEAAYGVSDLGRVSVRPRADTFLET